MNLPTTTGTTTTTLTRITESEIDAIALGAAVLGTGGGGDPHVGALIAKRMIRKHGQVEVMPVASLDDAHLVVPIGMIGAPSVSVEKVMAEHELASALSMFERTTGRTASAIMPIEIGGGNSMIPIAAAAMSGLPVVDGDAMGRAFPESQMVTFHLAGYGPGNTVLVDAQGNAVVTRPVNGAWSEKLARALSIQMGGSATMIDYAYGGEVVRECAVPETLTAAYRIGSILRSADVRDDQRIGMMLDDLGGTRLMDGKVTSVQRFFEGGFTKGTASVLGIGSDRGSVLELCFQNEMLLATRDGALAAVTPDLIAVLDAATGSPVTTERLKYGARVAVVAFPCHPMWRSPIGLATVGPRYFGYDVDFCPIEQLCAQEGQQ